MLPGSDILPRQSCLFVHLFARFCRLFSSAIPTATSIYKIPLLTRTLQTTIFAQSGSIWRTLSLLVIAFTALTLLPSPAAGQITYGGTFVEEELQDAGWVLTEPYTVPAGSNRVLIVNALAEEDGGTPTLVRPTTVTYGLVELTFLPGAEATQTDQGHTSLWYLLETDTVLFDTLSHDVVATWPTGGGAGGDFAIVAFSYNNVNQTTPFGTPNSNVGTSSPATVTVSDTAVGELVIDTTQTIFSDGASAPTGNGGGADSTN